jgi:predicted lipoprotein with Yx(FWY)xxD motif
VTSSSFTSPAGGRRTSIGLSVAAAAVLLLAACNAGGAGAGSASASASSSTSSGSATVVNVGQTSLGSVLTGADGKTLYLFTKDSDGKSACGASCVGNWPPLTVAAGAAPSAGSGVTGALSTITRDDGSMQVTINGHPLYHYAADKAAGDTNGQGVKDIWFAVTPSGDAVQASGASSAPSSAASTGASAGSSKPDYGY